MSNVNEKFPEGRIPKPEKYRPGGHNKFWRYNKKIRERMEKGLGYNDHSRQASDI